MTQDPPRPNTRHEGKSFCAVGLSVAVATALVDADGLDLRMCGCGLAGDEAASAGQPGSAFDVDHQGIPAAHRHVVRDLFCRSPVRAFSARAGDGCARSTDL